MNKANVTDIVRNVPGIKETSDLVENTVITPLQERANDATQKKFANPNNVDMSSGYPTQKFTNN
jgi:hypothetical protein